MARATLLGFPLLLVALSAPLSCGSAMTTPAETPSLIAPSASTRPVLPRPSATSAVPRALERRWATIAKMASGEGCRYFGDGQGPLVLSFDPSGKAGDFATATVFTDADLRFGDAPEKPIAVSIRVGALAFSVPARPDGATLYAKRRLHYLDVFEPAPTAELDAIAATSSTLVVTARAWKSASPVKVLASTPWTLKCADLGLETGTFAPTDPPNAQLGTGIAYGAFRLRATPGGPPRFELPPDSPVKVFRHPGQYSLIVFQSSEGTYRGFEANSQLNPGSGGFSRHGSRNRGLSHVRVDCKATPPLYLLHPDGRVMEVGYVAAEWPIHYSGEIVRMEGNEARGNELAVIEPPIGIELGPGFALAVTRPSVTSCRPMTP